MASDSGAETWNLLCEEKPFLHFHEKDSKRWADIKLGGEFKSVDLPFDPTKKQVADFLKKALEMYKTMTGVK